jgi:hypothetical protein
MNKLRLVINNTQSNLGKKNNFFNKQELRVILNLYAKMVSQGLWRDYSFNITKKNISFSIYKRTSENIVFNICKNFKPNNYNLKYYIADTQGNILSMSKNLETLIDKVRWNKYKIVN